MIKGIIRNTIVNSFYIYILYGLIHYISAYAYPYFCTPYGIAGFIKSFFLNEALHCQALRWTIMKTSESVTFGMILFGSYLREYMYSLHQEHKVDSNNKNKK